MYPFCLLVRKFQVQCQQQGKSVSGVFHPVGVADGGVEGAVGVAQAVGTGDFEGAIEVAQGPAVGGCDLEVSNPRASKVSTCLPPPPPELPKPKTLVASLCRCLRRLNAVITAHVAELVQSFRRDTHASHHWGR